MHVALTLHVTGVEMPFVGLWLVAVREGFTEEVAI